MSNAASGLAHLKPFLPGLGPLLEDAKVSEIMISPDYAKDLNPSEIWAQKKGRSSLI